MLQQMEPLASPRLMRHTCQQIQGTLFIRPLHMILARPFTSMV
jgi:hypothetical protein